MKLRSATLRTFTAVHTWTGLVAGFALFVAFYAGAITVFHHDLPAWQSRAVAEQPVQPLDETQRLLDGVLQRHPEARVHMGMLFPGPESSQSSAYWQDESGTWLYATIDDLDGSPKPPQAGLPELLNELHYSLGLPIVGTWLMGLVSPLYGLALLSGVVIHLPRLLQNLFALRPGRNLKQFWQDAHNVVGVLSLPMHVMFAITGALLCLLFVLMTALNPLVYDGKLMAAVPAAMDTAPVLAAAGVEAPADSLAMWRARSIEVARAQGIDDFEPSYLKLANAGDRNAVVEVTGESSRSLGPLGSVALDANTGELPATQLPGWRDANHATLAAPYALHFGASGNAPVPWRYFWVGVGGARAGHRRFRAVLPQAGQRRRPQRGGGSHRRIVALARPARFGGAGRQHRRAARHAAAGLARRQPRHAGGDLCPALRRVRQCAGAVAVLRARRRRRVPVLFGQPVVDRVAPQAPPAGAGARAGEHGARHGGHLHRVLRGGVGSVRRRAGIRGAGAGAGGCRHSLDLLRDLGRVRGTGRGADRK